MSLKKQGRYRFDDFEIDIAQRSLRRHEHSIAVSPRTFDLLIYFVSHPQRIVSKDELVHALWPESHLEESDLGQHIFLLRKALANREPGERLIVDARSDTRGSGYRFNAAVFRVEPSEEKIASPASEPADLDPLRSNALQMAPDIVSPRSRQLPKADHDDEEIVESGSGEKTARAYSAFRKLAAWQITLSTVLLMALALGSWQLWRWAHRPKLQSLSLFVRKFENATGEPQFDEALETALILDLQQSPYLTVASPSRVAVSSKAGDVCKSQNEQAYLTGKVEHFAFKYLLTIEAFDCASGHSIARSKGLANSPEGVVNILDKVAIDLRRQLGESSSSLARFNKPLFAAGAPSLGALKAYADAGDLVRNGKSADSVSLYDLALRLDAKLTMAYADLGAAYANLGQQALAAANLTKAYDGRETVDEPIRFFVVATYNRLVTRDLQAGIRNEKEWAAEYPHNPAPLGDLADLYMQTGKTALAIEPARQALALNPGNGLSYVLLARAQLRMGQTDEAASTCNLAIGRHLDDVQIHAILFEIAFLRLDQPTMDEQIAWVKDKPAEPYMEIEVSKADFAMGKVKAGLSILNGIAARHQARGGGEDEAAGDEPANHALGSAARAEAELGNLQSALALLTHLAGNADGTDASTGETRREHEPADSSTDLPVAYAEVGETARAEPMMQRLLDSHPFDTLLQQYEAPQIRAAMALVDHKPEEALDELQVAIPYDLRSFDGPMMRGRAYLAHKQPVLAEREFHKILDHPGVEPLSYNYPLAELGVARALAEQGKNDEASFAYKIVLQIWKDADQDMPRLKEARVEYAKVRALPVKTNPKQADE